jgi:hypothetical protein
VATLALPLLEMLVLQLLACKVASLSQLAAPLASQLLALLVLQVVDWKLTSP